MGYMTERQGMEIILGKTLKVLDLYMWGGLHTNEPDIEVIQEYFKLYDEISEICDNFPDLRRPPKSIRYDKLKALITESE